MTKVEEVARAIAPVMARLFNRMMSEQLSYGSVDVEVVARAAIKAMRAPSAGMVDAGAENVIGPCDVSYVFQAMCDAALQEGE